MPMTPPPPPLSAKQTEAAIKRGARTMKEIDPALHAWACRQSGRETVRGVVIAIGVVLFVVTCLLVLAH